MINLPVHGHTLTEVFIPHKFSYGHVAVGRIRTCDLQLMRLLSYQTALPRVPSVSGPRWTRPRAKFEPKLYPP